MYRPTTSIQYLGVHDINVVTRLLMEGRDYSPIH